MRDSRDETAQQHQEQRESQAEQHDTDRRGQPDELMVYETQNSGNRENKSDQFENRHGVGKVG